MRITKIAATGALIVGMSVPALAHVAWAEVGTSPTPFKADVAAGLSGETAQANDSDTAAELNVDDGQMQEVGEHEEADQVGTDESGSVADDESTADVVEHDSGEHGEHTVTGTVSTTPTPAPSPSGDQVGEHAD
jgi:hypothetical protein